MAGDFGMFSTARSASRFNIQVDLASTDAGQPLPTDPLNAAAVSRGPFYTYLGGCSLKHGSSHSDTIWASTY